MVINPCQMSLCGELANDRRNSFNHNRFRPRGRGFSDSL